MSAPVDRFGIFLVPAQYTRELEETVARVDALEFPGDGSVAPPEWRVARHELFERLLEVAGASRVLSLDALDAFAKFASSLDKRNRLAWDQASPVQRRELATKHLAKVTDPALRGAISEVLARDAEPEAGLWVEAEMALDPEPEPSEPSDDISPAELTRRLIEYVAKADREEAERERLQGPSRYAWLCELTDEAARGPVARMRAAALSSIKDQDGELTDALESFCHRAPVESLADCVYSAAQARELLAWLKKERRSATRDLMLRVLRPAVANKHGFAIVFVPAMK